jgi:PAS domain S-box-containing protein
MLTVGIASLEVLTAIRAYVEGEGLYSKGQKDAVYYLWRYAESHAEQDYEAYGASIARPLGDRDARLALITAPPDLERARAGFLAGGNNPDDVGRLIWFFRLFHHTPPFLHEIDLWTRGDAYTARIVQTAEAVHRDPAGLREPGANANFQAVLRDVTVGITPIENEFSATLGDVARQATRWLIGVSTLFATVIATLGLHGIRARRRDRAQHDAELRRSEARHRLFLRNASDGVHILDEQGRVVETSDSFCRMLGYSRDEVMELQVPDWDARVAERGPDPAHGRFALPTRFETVHRRKNGSTFEVEVHVEPFEAAGQDYLYCSARDITELRRLERAVLEATTREQRKLGYDLHDELGQELTGLSMLAASLSAVERAAGRPAAERLSEIEALARQAIGTCRAIAHGLSPLTYQGGDLVRALEEMVRVQGAGGSTHCRFSVAGRAPLRLAAETADNLYRIAQEAVTNARRHGSAREIRVLLEIDSSTVRVQIEDDGIGIPERKKEEAGMGLSIMKFRAAMIRGQLSIGRGRRGGTQIVCTCDQLRDVHGQSAINSAS